MSTPTEVIRDKAMANNDEYQRLHAAHAKYAAELDFLESKSYLSEAEKLEEVRLKKLKLRLKDQMAALLSGGKTAA